MRRCKDTLNNDLRHTRVAIIGTAQSWVSTPWTDTTLQCWSLNDAYRLKGFARADRWYDFHGLDKFHLVDGPTYAHQIPPGRYARPKEHLDWLAKQTIPIYLHPDYLTQHPDAVNWTHAHPFPKAAVEAHFGRYFTSSPAWMIAQAILEGCHELHVYGIHLATEFEYVKQRPNFEFLMGCVLGAGKRTMTVKNGLRYYESPDGRLVLPEASPILQESFQYAFDPRPDQHLAPMQWELHKLGIKKQRIAQALMAGWGPYTRLAEPVAGTNDTKVRMARRSALRDELVRLEALSQDWQERMGRAQPVGG